MKTKDEQIAEMNQANGNFTQRIGTALDLDPGTNIHEVAVRRIHAIRAHNQVLRAMCALALSLTDGNDIEGIAETMKTAIKLTSAEVMTNLENEYDELGRRQMTPTMEMIIQAVHDEAGRCDGELTSPIFIRVDPHDYDALCDEENAREEMLSGSSEESPRDDEYAPPEADPEPPGFHTPRH